jgi:two-component system sensor histidine kinase KdpD
MRESTDGYANGRPNMIRSWLERHGYVFAACSIAVSTAVFYPGRDYFAKGQWALLYLPIIVLVASISGVRPALLAAVLAFFSWNFFFLPPYHTFAIADPKDWLFLFVFLLVGIAMGLQTGRMRWRESEALAREREAALLSRFSSHLVSQMTTSGMAEILLEEVSKVTEAAGTALYLRDESGNLDCACALPGGADQIEPEIPRLASWAYEQAKAVGLPAVTSISETRLEGWPISVKHSDVLPGSTRKDIILPLQAASRMEGVLYVGARQDGAEYSVHDARVLVSIATQAEALREADLLKSAFLSSISHELKTPLASVTATITSLLEEDVEWDPATVRQELDAVGDALNRLNDSISSLLDLSRLEANAWLPQKDWYEVGEIVGSAISKLPPKQRERVTCSLPEDLPAIHVDFAQWARALGNLIENALSYSPADEIVSVGASIVSQEIRIWVEDRGPGIPPEERSRVFDKFYRGEASAKAPSGTGLGLAITREIVRSHGGRIWIEDVQPHGARFVISLPNAPSECKVT